MAAPWREAHRTDQPAASNPNLTSLSRPRRVNSDGRGAVAGGAAPRLWTKTESPPLPRPGPMVRRRNWRELTARSFPAASIPTPGLTQPPHMAVGGGGGGAAPRLGQNGDPPSPDRGRWYAGAIGASSPHGPSRPALDSDPTEPESGPAHGSRGAVGAGAAPRMGQNGVPAPPPTGADGTPGAIGASSPHGPSRGVHPTRTISRSGPAHGSRGAVGAARRHLVGRNRSARPSPRPGPMVRRRNWRELTARSFPQRYDPTRTSLRPRTWQFRGRWGRAAPRLGQNGMPAPPRPGPMVRRRNWRELTARSFPRR